VHTAGEAREVEDVAALGELSVDESIPSFHTIARAWRPLQWRCIEFIIVGSRLTMHATCE
jgi:hypothetical protein